MNIGAASQTLLNKVKYVCDAGYLVIDCRRFRVVQLLTLLFVCLFLRPEMVVGWYHSHPGFGCWLSGVDINTQQVHVACTCCGSIYPWFKFYFPLFWGMVMYDNELKTKRNKI